MGSFSCAGLGLALPRLPISAASSLKRLPLLISPSSSFPFSTLASKTTTPPPPPLFFCASSSPPLLASSSSSSDSLHFKQEHDDDDDEEFQREEQQENEEEKEASEPNIRRGVSQSLIPKRLPILKLSVKERKELSSFAHSLGKKLKTQQVGKSGVTPSLATSFLETLEANELLKLKIHGSCPGELVDVIKQLEAATGSAAVDQIGRTVILYRPSLSKMKKREAVVSQKYKEHSTFKMQKKGQAPRISGEGRHPLRRS